MMAEDLQNALRVAGNEGVIEFRCTVTVLTGNGVFREQKKRL